MLFSDNFNPCSYVPDSEKKYIKELTVWIFSKVHLMYMQVQEKKQIEIFFDFY